MAAVNFSGLASGIDSAALIDATIKARQAQLVNPNQDKITNLQDTNKALDDLRTKLQAVKDAAYKFTDLAGGAVAKQGLSSDETIATVVAQNSSTNGTYGLTVSQLAASAVYSFRSTSGAYTSDTTIAPSMVGSDNVVITTGVSSPDLETITVPMDNTTTLSGFVTSYNSQATKSVASIVDVGTSSAHDYRIVINTSNPGLQKGQISVSVGAAVTAANALNNNTQQQATDAQFSISGISGTITRSSNSITDVIPGVTINLASTGTANLQVTDDVDSTISLVQDFITAYNDLVTFIATNDAVTQQQTQTTNADGTTSNQTENIFSPLSNTRVDNGALEALRSNIVNSTYSSGTKVKIFSDLGIKTQRDGTLAFDPSDPSGINIKAAIASEPNSVKMVLQNFGNAAAKTGGTIDIYIRFQGLLDIAINGNTTQITNLNDQIARANTSINQEAETLRQRFTALEVLTSKLQSQQSQLTSALSGLSK